MCALISTYACLSGSINDRLSSLSLQLWALLHFIMPTLFDSHEEFNEWFSKDIESHAENKSAIDESERSRNVLPLPCLILEMLILLYLHFSPFICFFFFFFSCRSAFQIAHDSQAVYAAQDQEGRGK